MTKPISVLETRTKKSDHNYVLNDFDKARVESLNAEAWFAKGELVKGLGRKEEARKCIQKGCDLLQVVVRYR